MASVEEKKQETKKKITLTGVIVVVLSLIAIAIAIWPNSEEYDAKGHVEVLLNHTFQGETEAASELFGETEEKLQADYVARVNDVMEQRIDKGSAVDAELQGKYNELGKQIFAKMLYEVKTAEKLSEEEYRVTVEYQQADFMQKYQASHAAALELCNVKKENGEYKGSEEEIYAQIQTEYTAYRYAQMEEAVQTIEYQAPTTFVFTVKKTDDMHFGVSAQELDQFVEKIVGLEVKQD